MSENIHQQAHAIPQASPYSAAPKPPSTGPYAAQFLSAPPPAVAMPAPPSQQPPSARQRPNVVLQQQATGTHAAYRVAAGIASIAMAAWELLNFYSLMRWSSEVPNSIDVGYLLMLALGISSLVAGILLLAKRHRRTLALPVMVLVAAAIALPLFFIASVQTGWGFFYFLESACLIVPVLIIMSIGLRHP